MNQKGISRIEALIIFLVALVGVGFLSIRLLDIQKKKIVQFEEIFEINLRPHLSYYKTINPEAKKTIQEDVARQLIELWREYYEVWSERREVRRKPPGESGGVIKQLERLKELNNTILQKWAPYKGAKESAEWWDIPFDLPETSGR